MTNVFLNFHETLHMYERKMFSQDGVSTSDVIELAEKYDGVHRETLAVENHIDLRQCFSSISSILSSWAHSNAVVSSEQLRHLVEIKSALVIMYLAGFDPKQEILLRGYNKDNGYKQNLTKILLLISINNITQDLYRAFLRIEPDTAYYIACSWLMEKCQVTKNARVYHQKLVDGFDKYKDVKVEPEFFVRLSNVYMYTSYSNSVGKDEIKSTICHQISNTIYRYNPIKDVSTSRNKLRSKPTILIIHEKFANNHVMMRCYLRTIAHLEEKFDLIHLAFAPKNYDQLHKEASSIITVDGNFRIAIKKIKEIDPDIILYPSLGMHPLPMMLSTLRLAPIQLQLFGHPSSSFSKEIDGSWLNTLNFDTAGPEKCTKNVAYEGGIPIDINSLNFEYHMSNRPASQLNEKLNVVVNGKSMKLSPRFIEFLGTINWPNDVQLNFFPAERGIYFAITESLIKKYFPKARIYPTTDYDDYIKNLAIQDCAICPFPFGNTNCIIDSLKIGLPTFVLKGNEICSAAEYELLNFCDLGDFVLSSQEEMAAALTNFLHNKKLRLSLTEKFQTNANHYLTTNNVAKAQRIRAQSWSNWITNHIVEYKI